MLTIGGKRGREEGDEEEESNGISRFLLSIMEGYSDAVIPPLTDFSFVPRTTAAIDEKASSSMKRGRAKIMGSEGSIQKERKRRGKMTELFSVLESMVPNVFPKASRGDIVAETIEYIHRLEGERERLENLRNSVSSELTAARPTFTQSTNRSSSVNVTVSHGGVAFFGIQTVPRRRLAAEIFGAFDKHEAEVLAASVSVNGGHQQQWRLDLSVTAVVGGNGDSVEKIKRDILDL